MVKKSASYNVDEEILKAFNKKTKEQAINKSKWIENKIREFLKEGETK